MQIFVVLVWMLHTPDHSTISRFKNLLIKHKLLDKLMNELNRQFNTLGILLKTGSVVDATIVNSAARPRKKIIIETEPIGDSENSTPMKFVTKKLEKKESKDTQARWIKKGRRFAYGYKGNIAVDPKYGLVQEIITTPANVHDTTVFGCLIKKTNLPPKSRVYADKGYCSKKNRLFLDEKNLKKGIMFKFKKNDSTGLKRIKTKYNMAVSKTRYIVERTFGTLHKSYGYERVKYFGLKKTHFFLQMGAIAFNLKRAAKILEFELNPQIDVSTG